MKVLAVAPCFDAASEYSFKWWERLREAIKDKVQLTELLKDMATKTAFESNVEAFKPDAIVFYNHGSEDCLCAQGGESCVLDTKDVDKVAGKIIYTMACLSAAKLGAVAYVNYGCVYVGYVKEFGFTTNDEELFCYAANSGFIAYVNGEGDWAKIKQIMIDAFNKAMEQTDNPWTKVWLSWDRDNLRIYTEGVDTPESKCVLRNTAIKLFGPKLGWRISRKHALSIILLGAGTGVYLHDRVAEWVRLGCRLHGLDVGFALIFIAWVLISFEFVKWLKYS